MKKRCRSFLLLLLLCGLAAYWGALGREKLRLARRSHIRRTGGTSRAAKWCRKKYYPLAFGGAALVIAVTAVFVSRDSCTALRTLPWIALSFCPSDIFAPRAALLSVVRFALTAVASRVRSALRSARFSFSSVRLTRTP